MPNTRENLIELLGDMIHFSFTQIGKEMIADHLIANGVTVQEWIPVTERLPEVDTLVLYFAPFDHNEWDMGVACFRDKEHFWQHTGATHWMPLPEPPKEV